MKKLAFVATLTTLLLSACGGGSSTTEAAPPPVPSKLAAYVGNWVGVCRGRSLEYFAITDTAGVKDSITYAVTTDYFAQDACAGAVIATGKYNTNFTAAYTGSADAGVVFTFGSASMMSKIDLVLSTQPGFTYTVTGANVVHTTSNGMDTWCIGDGYCTTGQGTVAAQASVNGGLYYSANKMYVLAPSGSIYNVAESYTKK
jgi:hypothetical protein